MVTPLITTSPFFHLAILIMHKPKDAAAVARGSSTIIRAYLDRQTNDLIKVIKSQFTERSKKVPTTSALLRKSLRLLANHLQTQMNRNPEKAIDSLEADLRMLRGLR